MMLFGCRDTLTALPEQLTPTKSSNSDMSISSLKTSAKKVNISREELNEAIEQTAIALASALKDVEIRRLVKAEVKKKFDGDFDVLFSAISDKRLSDGKTFMQKLGRSRANQQRRLGKLYHF